MRLILASSSPRRRQLLMDAGIVFELAEPYETAEVWPPELPAEEIAEYLAGVKSDAFPRELAPDEVLLTADTTVVVGDEILGKPHDRDEATGMLERLSGREHRVITGVVLRGRRRRESFRVDTRVWFRPLRREEIVHYVDTFRPFDKAGAYGIQEWIGLVGVERIDGSFYNVMGLPVQAIYNRLNELKIKD